MKSFGNTIQPEIHSFAERILTEQDFKEIDAYIDRLDGNKEKRRKAVEDLQNVFDFGPKRPLYYLRMALRGLPEQTRDIMRYSGDYIDQLLKYVSYDMGNQGILKLKTNGLKLSLGTNLRKLRQELPLDLYTNLEGFNNVLYVPAKHQFEVKGRPHLFSAREAITSLYIMKRLAPQISILSENAKLYSENKMADYFYDKSQRY